MLKKSLLAGLVATLGTVAFAQQSGIVGGVTGAGVATPGESIDNGIIFVGPSEASHGSGGVGEPGVGLNSIYGGKKIPASTIYGGYAPPDPSNGYAYIGGGSHSGSTGSMGSWTTGKVGSSQHTGDASLLPAGTDVYYGVVKGEGSTNVAWFVGDNATSADQISSLKSANINKSYNIGGVAANDATPLNTTFDVDFGQGIVTHHGYADNKFWGVNFNGAVVTDQGQLSKTDDTHKIDGQFFGNEAQAVAGVAQEINGDNHVAFGGVGK